LAEYRLNELSALSGVSSRNIRAYRERGLLDPPRREGRSAVYNDQHLSELRTINELLGRGFTSAHIAEFFASIRQGHDLADDLGLHEAIFGEHRPTVAVAVDIDPDGDDARRLVGYGLAEVVDGELRLPDVISGVGEELVAAVVRALEASLAARFGQNHVVRPEDMIELRQVSVAYRALVRRVVADQIEAVLQRQIASAVSEYTTDTVIGGRWDPKDR
jgi:DNA-binding transcriptional MerR regulator